LSSGLLALETHPNYSSLQLAKRQLRVCSSGGGLCASAIADTSRVSEADSAAVPLQRPAQPMCPPVPRTLSMPAEILHTPRRTRVNRACRQH
jgi:hypothetical protein